MRLLRNQTLVAVSVAVGAAYTGIGLVGPLRILYAQSPGAVYGDCVLAGGLVIRSAGAPAYRTVVTCTKGAREPAQSGRGVTA